MKDLNTYTAFKGKTFLYRGPLEKVVLKVKQELTKNEDDQVLIFSDLTGIQMDFNLQGTEAEILKRLEIFLPGKKAKASVGAGRPKLGVISREISLLPQHWEWLENQSGGASVNIRKLIETASKENHTNQNIKKNQEVVYNFMSVMAGNLPGYEEALRFLYRKNKTEFCAIIEKWPKDIRNHIESLSEPVFN